MALTAADIDINAARLGLDNVYIFTVAVTLCNCFYLSVSFLANKRVY